MLRTWGQQVGGDMENCEHTGARPVTSTHGMYVYSSGMLTVAEGGKPTHSHSSMSQVLTRFRVFLSLSSYIPCGPSQLRTNTDALLLTIDHPLPAFPPSSLLFPFCFRTPPRTPECTDSRWLTSSQTSLVFDDHDHLGSSAISRISQNENFFLYWMGL